MKGEGGYMDEDQINIYILIFPGIYTYQIAYTYIIMNCLKRRRDITFLFLIRTKRSRTSAKQG